MKSWDRYGSDVLKQDPLKPRLTASAKIRAEIGLVVEDSETGWVGAIVRVEKSGGMLVVVLEDRHGEVRSFRMGPGFLIDGEPVALIPAGTPAAAGKTRRRTASGSIAVEGARARVARPSRIWVEGRHDAELVARVWGEDLALEGVVVETLEGVDHLAERVAQFGPQAGGARLGVLVDHLVEGSKEWRIAQEVTASCEPGSILILGHPYVDVWEAVKPARLGLNAWPQVQRGTEWKYGVLRALGWPHQDQADIAAAWRRILGTVRNYRDLEPALLGRVEELIDFTTAPTLGPN
ncbi:MAG: DUF3097 domain-containing protein [Bifidobacteriaceae bacterium]|jgi:hypothetical protein|nr:DUF3097 domain-containing protein [Bifidobacteriaceae bacterium]